MYKILLMLFLTGFNSFSSTFPYNGTVQNLKGNPIKNAKVLLIKENIETYTDAFGQFGEITSIGHQENVESFFKPKFCNGILYYYSNKMGDRVIVEIFNFKGQIVFLSQNKSSYAGINAINLRNRLSSGLYVLRLTIDNNISYLKINSSTFYGTTSSNYNIRVKRSSFVEEVLKISALGYNDTSIIPTSENIGTVTLFKSDVPIDNTPPVITLGVDNPDYVIVNSISKYAFTVTAYDVLNDSTLIDVSSMIEVENNVDPSACDTYYVYLSVHDESDNFTYDTLTVFVVEESFKDTIAPIITLIGKGAIQHVVNTPYIDLGAEAYDDVDGDVSNNIIAVGIESIDVTKLGTYLILYYVNDAAGNCSDTLRRYVFVTYESNNLLMQQNNVVP